MSNVDPPAVQIVRLRERAVICEFSTCEDEAEFLLKRPPNQVMALCREHLKALGVPEKEIPDK